jgi:hypothetical protein
MTRPFASHATLAKLSSASSLAAGAWCLLLALLLAGCTSKPSDDDAVRAFKERESNAPASSFALENIRRIDGYARDDGLYVVKIQYDMVALMDHQQAAKQLVGDLDEDSPEKMRLEVGVIPSMEQKFGKFRKGQRFTRTAELVLRRSEAGWTVAQ